MVKLLIRLWSERSLVWFPKWTMTGETVKGKLGQRARCNETRMKTTKTLM